MLDCSIGWAGESEDSSLSRLAQPFTSNPSSDGLAGKYKEYSARIGPLPD